MTRHNYNEYASSCSSFGRLDLATEEEDPLETLSLVCPKEEAMDTVAQEFAAYRTRVDHELRTNQDLVEELVLKLNTTRAQNRKFRQALASQEQTVHQLTLKLNSKSKKSQCLDEKVSLEGQLERRKKQIQLCRQREKIMVKQMADMTHAHDQAMLVQELRLNQLQSQVEEWKCKHMTIVTHAEDLESRLGSCQRSQDIRDKRMRFLEKALSRTRSVETEVDASTSSDPSIYKSKWLTAQAWNRVLHKKLQAMEERPQGHPEDPCHDKETSHPLDK